MKRIFTQEEINLLIEALESQEADIEQEIVESEEANAATSVIFALSKDMVACDLMLQFLRTVQEQDDLLYAEGVTTDWAVMMSDLSTLKSAESHYQSVDQQ